MRYHRAIHRALITVVLLTLATPALARDDDWGGGFIAIEGGIAAARLRATSTDPILQVTNVNPAGLQPLTIVPGTNVSVNTRDDQTSLLYGVVLGFEGQAGNFVFGVEGDAHGPRDSGSSAQTLAIPATALSPPSTVATTRDLRTRYDWSVRGRLGIAMGSTLIYATGGVASAQVRLRASDVYTLPAGSAAPSVSNGGVGVVAPAFGPITTSGSQTRTLTGWTAGGGIEHKLGTGGLTIGLDARYADYGSKTYTLPSVTTVVSGSLVFTGAEGGTGNPIPTPIATPGPTRVSLSDVRVAVRLAWHF